jgi:di/tricarboxylate transporter
MMSPEYLAVALSTAAIPTEVIPGPAQVGLWLVALLALSCAILWFLGESPQRESAGEAAPKARRKSHALRHRLRWLAEEKLGHKPIFSQPK